MVFPLDWWLVDR